MRTKTLILSALLGVAATPLFAQTNVYSVNAVGYVQQSLVPGQFAMIANPLNTTNNRISSILVLPDANAGSQVWKWTGSSYTSAIWQGVADGWTQPNLTLNPGEGCFIKLLGTAYTNTWVGEVMQGTLSNSIPVGFSIRSSMVPQSGDADSLGISTAATPGDTLYRFNPLTGTYQSAIYQGAPDGWTSSTALNVGQSFFYKTTAVNPWVRTFSVNN
jgi:hypothetical protein